MITNTFTRKFNREVGKSQSLDIDQKVPQAKDTETFVTQFQLSITFNSLNKSIEQLREIVETKPDTKISNESDLYLKIESLESYINILENRLSSLEASFEATKNSKPINSINYENVPATKKPARRGIKAKTPSDDALS